MLDTARPSFRRAPAPLRHQVLDYVRQAIISGRLAPGARLVERDLIEMMGVSRTVIREALRQLETEGLVATIPNKGPVLRELTAAEAKDLYAIRGALLGLAARLFVQNAEDADVQALRAALDETAACYETGDPNRILDAKTGFYDVLVAGAGSESLSAMVSTLHARIWRWRALGLGHPSRSPTRSRESIEGLRAMYEAIAARDAANAERFTREETDRAAIEVVHLLATG